MESLGGADLEEANCYRCGQPVTYNHEAALADYKERFEDADDRPVVICNQCDDEIQKLDQREEWHGED